MQDKVLELAKESDNAIDSKDDDSIKKVIEKCSDMIETLSDSNEIGYAYYCMGNLYAALDNYEVPALNSYRLAKKSSIDELNYYDLICKIKTNEANQLSRQYRYIEAISVYDEFIRHIIPSESKIISLIHTINNLCSIGQFIKNKNIAQYYFIKALMLKRVLLEIKKIPNIDKHYHDHDQINTFLTQHPLQEQENIEDGIKSLQDIGSKDLFRKSEQEYRTWCLENILFLNHMNDLVFSYHDAKDTISFPDYIIDLDNDCFVKPHLAMAFANIKREFCFARYLAYEGISKKYPKFEEKHLGLASEYYNSDYSGKTERLKASFRFAFGLLDKSVNLLISYLKLDKNEIKKTKGCRIVEFKPKFFETHLKEFMRNNEFIKALYFVACELNNQSEFRHDNVQNDLLLGEAKHFKNLRNDLEHNWVHVLEFIFGDPKCCEQDYATYIESEQLEYDTIKVLKLVRSCLIYLVFAIQIEENKQESNDEKLIKLKVPIWSSK
ncbi:LA2681 family HEPN domain-containing protein [Francisella philomiragia]|uniref:LA2681 family HEPN domain-containing protein n=1 Tax=Francisella philomiragia TaxID=28110 RepID=UPI003513FB61